MHTSTVIKENAKTFPLEEARGLVKDLMLPKATTYWIDFLFSISLAWAAFALAVLSPYFSLEWWAGYVVSSLMLYRSVLFTHELAHFKKGTFKFFRLMWNLLCGGLLLVPSFTYNGVHNDHHKRDVYGTKDDGEYMPFGAQSPVHIITYMCLIFFLPFLFVLRFLILAPLSLIVPPLGRLVWQHLSSLTIDLTYRRPLDQRNKLKTWRLQELLAVVYCWSATLLVIDGILPAKFLVMWYLASVFMFLLNSLRTLSAHAYTNPGDEKMSVSEQFLDSVDVPGNFLTALWAPVGLRFHATHHLFPNMPYHNLAIAHKRLKTELSDNSQYLSASRSSLIGALSHLWHDATISQSR